VIDVVKVRPDIKLRYPVEPSNTAPGIPLSTPPHPTRTAPADSHTNPGGTTVPPQAPNTAVRPLRNPVGHRGLPESSHAFPIPFRYLNATHRRREIRPRGHPIPKLVEVPFQVLLELCDRLPVDTRSPTIGLDHREGIQDNPSGNVERLLLRLWPADGSSAASQLTTRPARTTRPLRSTRITELHRYYEAVRPCSPHRYPAPRGGSHLEVSLSPAG
jgi:hypothetical protein